MCGIAGIVRFDGLRPERSEILSMTGMLTHRGPDGSGVFTEGPVALGHTRLAIIDISSGSQPMLRQTRRGGSLAVTFNGEIYNYRELRAELESLGHAFSTTSDTETILAAYDEWGPECVGRLSGMFAFAVADYPARRLFLARDHAGVKPLFYRMEPGWISFASELSALRAFGETPRGDLQAVDYFLRYQYIPAPFTVYRGVRKLPPAHTLTVPFAGPRGARCEPERYWRLEFDGPAPDPEEVSEELLKAVSRSLVADVPVGIFLSGGMDSTLVAMLASRFLGSSLSAFCIGFAEEGYDESKHAREAARVLGLPFHCEIISGRTLEILPDLVRHYGEPFGDASAIPTWHVSRLARGHVKTVLSGDGGDEAFCGYDRYFHWATHRTLYPSRRRELLADLRAGRFRRPQAVLEALGSEAWSRYVIYTFYPQRKRLWRPELRHLADTPCPPFTEAHRHARRFSRLSLAQSTDFETYLPGAILYKMDIAAMYHGLEVRPSLLDPRLLELAARLPARSRYNGGSVGKVFLQSVLAEAFPPSFISRPKQGFGIPRGKWLSRGHLGHEMLHDFVLAEGSRLREWMAPRELRRHVAMHEQGLDNSQHLWLLLILAIWADQNRSVTFS